MSETLNRLNRVLATLASVLLVAVAALGATLLLGRGSDKAGIRVAGQAPLATQSGSSSILPQASPLPMPVTPPPCVPPHDWVPHVVQEGNTLYSLAQRYGTDIETLMRVNCLDNDLISIDQELYVPGALAATGQPPITDSTQASPPIRYLNIVLLGSDKRQDTRSWRTDTMIVVSVDSEHKGVRLLSIPRDLWVNIPGHGYDRINTADLWGELASEGGGPKLVKETIARNLGIPVQYYVRVDFAGFVKIIDAIGGLDVDVECALPDIGLMPGMHHMDGEQALLYARSRKSTSDFDRARRQRKLLMALWEQGLSMNLLPRLPALWVAMTGAFQTDIPLDRVFGLAYVGLQLKPNQIHGQSIGPLQVEDWVTPEGAAVLLPRDDKIQELLAAFYGSPDTSLLEKTNQTRVQVLNGSQRQEAEQLAATALGRAGFQIAGASLAGSQDYAETQIIVYNADQDMAGLVAEQLRVPPSAILMQPDASGSVDIQVILGADYDPCSAG